MTDDQFWSIIARLDWSRSGDDEAVLAPAVSFETFSNLPGWAPTA